MEFGPDDEVRFRTFNGSVVHGKDADDTAEVARRVLDMDLDVLAVQEIENIEALRTFNTDSLGGLCFELTWTTALPTSRRGQSS